MKNNIKKIISKTTFITTGLLLVLKNSIYGINTNSTMCLYGIPKPEPEPNLLLIFLKNLGYYLTIPIIFTLGLILYWKRSKAMKKEKIVFTIIFVIIGLTLVLLFNFEKILSFIFSNLY